MSAFPGVSSPVDRLTVQIFLHLVELDAEWQRTAATCSDAVELAEAKERCVEVWRGPLHARLDALFAEMSEALSGAEPASRAAAEAFHRRLVQPYFLQSPFCRRAVDKPLGYPGDYGLVEMIFSGKEKCETPLGAVLGAYALECGPSAAHRGRLAWAGRELDRYVRDTGREHPRILSFACGPEVVLREWVRGGGAADILLADHDADALAHAKKRLLKARGRGNPTNVEVVEANAFALLRGIDPQAVLGGESGFDVVLVLGLLDYLDDPQVTRLLGALAGTLRAEGRLLTSNLATPNPWRSLMELTSDWNVAHRSVAGFEALVTGSERLVPLRTEVHASGTNLYNVAALV